MSKPHTHHDEHEPHAAPLWILCAVFGALLVLTVLTVGTAKYLDLGEFNLPLAMLIALIKGTLVALFFMHLFWDHLFNSIALLAGLAFLALFIGFSIMDVRQSLPQVEPLPMTMSVQNVSGPEAMFPVKHHEAHDGDHGHGDDHDHDHGDHDHADHDAAADHAPKAGTEKTSGAH